MIKSFITATVLGLAICSSASANVNTNFNSKDVECLAKNLYFEARGEGIDGMMMVAEVTLNRVGHDSYPDTICDVVYQKNAFEWTRMRLAIRDKEKYKDAKDIAISVLEGDADLIGTDALFFKRRGHKSKFHDTRIYLGSVGNHEFYK